MRLSFVLALLALGACGGATDSSGIGTETSEAQEAHTYGVTLPSTNSLQGPEAKGAGDRVKPHKGITFPNMRVHVVYIGEDGTRAPSHDAFMKEWFPSSSWAALTEYGIGPATLTGVTNITTSLAVREDMYEPEDTIGVVGHHQLVRVAALDGRIHELVHGVPASSGEDGGPPRAAEEPVLPAADAYVIFMPSGIDVAVGRRGSVVQRTCVDAGAYHAWDGDEAYAVMPPCELGRSTYALSHELAEMATDPQLALGWSSDDDGSKSAGEIADLCKGFGPVDWNGYKIARFWSNKGRVCVPR